MKYFSCFLLLTLFTSCSKDLIPTLNDTQIKKWYDESLPFEFRTDNNFTIPYVLDTLKLLEKQKQGISFCSQMKKDFAKIESFYQKNFSFYGIHALNEKGFECGWDTCFLKNPNSNCQFTLYYVSNPTNEVQFENAKPLEKLLISSDNFYSQGRAYILRLRIQIDIDVSRDPMNGIPKSILNISTTFYWKKRSLRDKNDWNAIGTDPKYFSEGKYTTFLNAYHTELLKACDGETLKYNMLKNNSTR